MASHGQSLSLDGCNSMKTSTQIVSLHPCPCAVFCKPCLWTSEDSPQAPGEKGAACQGHFFMLFVFFFFPEIWPLRSWFPWLQCALISFTRESNGCLFEAGAFCSRFPPCVTGQKTHPNEGAPATAFLPAPQEVSPRSFPPDPQPSALSPERWLWCLPG